MSFIVLINIYIIVNMTINKLCFEILQYETLQNKTSNSTRNNHTL